MQALLTALEQRGWTITLTEDHKRRGITVALLGEKVTFHLVEKTKQVLTGNDYPRYDLVPTGVLSFDIGDWWPTPALTDGKTKKLEPQ